MVTIQIPLQTVSYGAEPSITVTLSLCAIFFALKHPLANSHPFITRNKTIVATCVICGHTAVLFLLYEQQAKGMLFTALVNLFKRRTFSF